MAIRQEKRIDAPMPEVVETDYGAQTVTASTETPIMEEKAEDLDPVEEEVKDEAPAGETVLKEKPVVPKKAKGRPKKARK